MGSLSLLDKCIKCIASFYFSPVVAFFFFFFWDDILISLDNRFIFVFWDQ